MRGAVSAAWGVWGMLSSESSATRQSGSAHGLGETFAPHLQTGTANFTVPIALPSGRRRIRPDVELSYSSGNGDGPFGFGWSLSVPGINRKTAAGIPSYDDARDVFVLSGSEDLVPVPGAPPGATRYRPRTEGLFALIDHVTSGAVDRWEVRACDGSVSYYGALPGGPASGLFGDPRHEHRIFGWRLVRTADTFGNHVDYSWMLDTAADDTGWNQIYPSEIRYVDYGDPASPQYLVTVRFVWEPRPTAFSDFRAGFELRTRLRCRRIEVRSHHVADTRIVTYHLAYAGDPDLPPEPLNGASLLSRIHVEGHNGNESDWMPPLDFTYTTFSPQARRFAAVSGEELPMAPLGNPGLGFVDLFGQGLPDLLELANVTRYWRNMGNGQFGLPRSFASAPAAFEIADPAVRLADADGDGRTDLLVTTDQIAGYFPLQFAGGWDRRFFQRYESSPPFDYADPELRLVDLNGDGVVDAIRSGARLECFFQERRRGWTDVRVLERQALDEFPDVSFSDPRVRIADMNGDGLQDIVLIYGGSIDYWPSAGGGQWGRRVTMHNGPRLPEGYDVHRVLVGDIDGDGAADVAYVGQNGVSIWINQGGRRWNGPIDIPGTPAFAEPAGLALIDLLGKGTSGLLWSREAFSSDRPFLYFLDFVGGSKPYLLTEMRNNCGGVLRAEYSSSTDHFLDDERHRRTRWKTTLPFPVPVLSRVITEDLVAGLRMTTRFRYHHGYWDGAEREFRGFGRVDQIDVETMTSQGIPEAGAEPIETRTWFHLGPVGDEFGNWIEVDYRDEFWAGDVDMLERPAETTALLARLPRRARRDAIRALRGAILRAESYGRDGSKWASRPYVVVEESQALREESPPQAPAPEQRRIFAQLPVAKRVTRWERGLEPMTNFAFTDNYDEFGQPRSHVRIGVPRGRDPGEKLGAAAAAEPYLAFHEETAYAQLSPAAYITGRPCATAAWSVPNDGKDSVMQLKRLIDSGVFKTTANIQRQSLIFYDGAAFVGLPFGQVGAHGAPVRTETLVFTEAMLAAAGVTAPYLTAQDSTNWSDEYPAEFRSRLAPHAGYVFRDSGPGVPGFYATQSNRFDFQQPGANRRGRILASRDALGRTTTYDYDDYDLLATAVIDPVGLQTRTEADYRVFRPRLVTDPNGNQTFNSYDGLGFLTATALLGKGTGDGGDTLAQPGSRLTYDLHAFMERGEPLSVRTTRRVHTATASPPTADADAVVEEIDYSDGFGRLLQARRSADGVVFGDSVTGDVAATAGDVVGVTTDQPRVAVTGWQVYDAKGRVIRKFDPFYTSGWEYTQPSASELLRSTRIFYDPRGQVLRTVNPDGSEQRVVPGVPDAFDDPTRFVPTPWELYAYDANDNAGRTHPDDAAAYASHWNTPVSVVVDAWGRATSSTRRNGPHPATDWFVSSSVYNSRGALVETRDELGRTCFRYSYDLVDRAMTLASLDGGTTIKIHDAAGNLVEERDATGSLILTSYDALDRPSRQWARDRLTSPVTLRQRLEYGDAGTAQQPAAERNARAAINQLGKLRSHADEAGLLEHLAYDLRGNLLAKTRRVFSDATMLAGLPSAGGEWAGAYFVANWHPADGQTFDQLADQVLDAAAHRTDYDYDALNRLTRLRHPEDADGARRALNIAYDSGGNVTRTSLDDQTVLDRAAYNARGQRSFAAYGNGVMTRYERDPLTARLSAVRTERYTKQGDLAYSAAAAQAPLQDFRYQYDAAGNLLRLDDTTPGSGVMNSLDGANHLVREFEHDPLYRLLTATGRECRDIAVPRPWTDAATCGFDSGAFGSVTQDNAPAQTEKYTERYTYDPAGNITSLRHTVQGHTWVRHFGMGGLTPSAWAQAWPAHLDPQQPWLNAPGNRMTHAADDDPAGAATHEYDAAGRLIRETASRAFEWGSSSRLRAFRVQAANAEASTYSMYLYDAGGDRMKTLVRKQGGATESSVFVGGIFERHRIEMVGGAVTNTRLHVLDGRRVLFSTRAGVPFPDDGAPAVLFHMEDHLGSCCVSTDAAGTWVNREEFTPLGDTAVGSFRRKRFRFTGKPRDRDSGLYYFGARYLAPWLGRWISCDPAGLAAGLNEYAYARGAPLRLTDPTGLDGEDSYPPPPTVVLPKGTQLDDGSISDTTVIEISPMVIVGDKPKEPETPVLPEYGVTGVRLNPKGPREHYKNFRSQGYADRGLVKLAEVAEAGHGCALCHLQHFMTPEEAEANLDLQHYDNLASALGTARDDLALTVVTVGASSGWQMLKAEERLVQLNRRAAEIQSFLAYEVPTASGTTGLSVPAITRTSAAVTEGNLAGVQVQVITHTKPEAYSLLEKAIAEGTFKLKPGEILGGAPTLVNGRTAVHSEIAGVTFFTELGVERGLVGTWPKQCPNCFMRMARDFPGFEHGNPVDTLKLIEFLGKQ